MWWFGSRAFPSTLDHRQQGSLRKPCLMIDGGYPKNLDAKVAGAGGIHVLKGGIVEFWQRHWLVDDGHRRDGEPQRQMFACFAEAMLLEFERCHTNFSWGRNNITLEKMDFIGAASVRHGFSTIEPPSQPAGHCRLTLSGEPCPVVPCLSSKNRWSSWSSRLSKSASWPRIRKSMSRKQLQQLETLAARRRQEIFQGPDARPEDSGRTPPSASEHPGFHPDVLRRLGRTAWRPPRQRRSGLDRRRWTGGQSPGDVDRPSERTRHQGKRRPQFRDGCPRVDTAKRCG